MLHCTTALLFSRVIGSLRDTAVLSFVVAAAAFSSAAGCTNFEPPSVLDSFRILAVKAEPPEVAPGETSRLTAYRFDLAGRPSTVDWWTCLIAANQGSGSTVPDACLTAVTNDQLYYDGNGDSVTVTMRPLDCSRQASFDATLGVYEPIRVRAAIQLPDGTGPDLQPPPDAGDVIPQSYGDAITGLVRLRYHIPFIPLPRNRNPTLVGLYAKIKGGGADFAKFSDGSQRIEFHKSDTLTLRAAFADGSREPYCVIGAKSDTYTQTGICAALQAGLTGALGGGGDGGMRIGGGESCQSAGGGGGGGGGALAQFDPNQVVVEDATEFNTVTWYATNGDLANDTSAGADANAMPVGMELPDNDLKTDKYLPDPIPAAGLPIQIFAVGRDGRGGVDIASGTVYLLP